MKLSQLQHAKLLVAPLLSSVIIFALLMYFSSFTKAMLGDYKDEIINYSLIILMVHFIFYIVYFKKFKVLSLPFIFYTIFYIALVVLISAVLWFYKYDYKSYPAKIHSLFSTIYIVGSIDFGDEKRFLDELESMTFNPRKLVVSSPGGISITGLKIGEDIKSYKLNIEVANACLSACANYFFPAANRKIFSDSDALAWHGSYNSPEGFRIYLFNNKILRNTNEFDEEARLEDIENKKIEKEFYEYLEVNQDLPTCAQTKKLIPLSNPEQFYFYSLKDLELMGLKNIDFIGSESKWMDYQKSNEFLLVDKCS
jgi:hypothetical protein